MNYLDWVIVALALALGFWGYRQGLIVAALTLFGFASGALLGSRLGTVILAEGSRSPYAPLFAALAALLIGAIVAISVEGLALDLREQLVRSRVGHVIDAIGGAALIAALALALAWVIGAVVLHAPGTVELRADVQRSAILRNLNALLPPSGPLLNALSRVDPAPSVTEPIRPVAPPDVAIARDPDVEAAALSVVRVLGTACGLGVEGSGWMATEDLVVTNAHVVAGQDDTTVTTGDGASLETVPVHYDPRNDLALLRIDEGLPALSLAPEPRRGTGGAVLGYPENGPYSLSPVRLGETQRVLSEDAYGRGPFQRTISFLRGTVRTGHSGGPIVDSAGQVMGTIFAASTSGPNGGYAVPNQVVDAALGEADEPVDTGPCAG